MSTTHPYWTLPLDGSGQLILTPCPGAKETPMEAALQQLKEAGATAVLTALEPGDLAEDGLAQLAQACETLGLKWFHLPIEDDCAPGDEFHANWPQANRAAQAMLDQGESLAIHCMGGSGRTGLIAARLMLERGVALDTAIAQIQALRPGAFTRQVHLDYIRKFQ